MKKASLLIILFLFIITTAYLLFVKNKKVKIINKSTENSSTEYTKTTDDEEIINKDVDNKNDDDILKVDWIEIRDLSGVFMYSNLEDKLQSTELINKYGCSTLVNASFYTKENNHTGLFISEGNKLQDWKSSELFNGILSITNEQKALITKLPVDDARISVQSGPVLIEDNEEVTLNIINDKPARRIVAALKKNNNLIFIAFYNQGTKTSGPTLTELPSLLSKLNSDKKLNIISAINLDGGSASAYITDDTRLQEVTRIGSFFCVQSGLIVY